MYRLELLEIQLIKTTTGRRVRTIIEEQAEEVMMLINKNRNVTLVWHRNKGPQFIAKAYESGIKDNIEIPPEIEGIKLNTLLRRIAAVLQEHGSPFLKKAIGKHSLMVFNTAKKNKSLKAIFEEFKTMDQQFNLDSNNESV